MRARAFLAMAGLVSVCLACTPLPDKQLSTYVDAFSHSADAGRALYLGLNDLIAAKDQKAASTRNCHAATPAPLCFDPNDYLTAAVRPVDPDIDARLLTFDLVVLYNDTLFAMASGASSQTIQTRLDSVSGILGKIVAVGVATGPLGTLLTSGAIGSLGTLLATLEKARATGAARMALVDGAPTIHDAIAALIADTPVMYKLYRDGEFSIVAHKAGALSSADAQAEIAKIPAFHQSLAAYVVLLEQTSISLDDLSAALQAQNSDPAALSAALDQAIAVRAAADNFRKIAIGLKF